MKKTSSAPKEDEPMREHYDFSGGVRGKYAQRYAEGTNIVLLEPDVADAFPTADAVNAALRKVLKESAPGTRRPARRRNA
ncbi:MAG TPA: hypothetical protein VFM71_13965 [Gemmatimonadaceae bacterium]|nr:hypothetical protein [Gemmatimonadaceae bacterium]